MPLYLPTLLSRLLLALSLVLGPWPAVLTAAPSNVEAAVSATVAAPPCHRPAGEPSPGGAASVLPAPCCDGPCVGCAPALCGLGHAVALPMDSVTMPRRVVGGESFAPPTALSPTPDPRERLRPPIA